MVSKFGLSIKSKSVYKPIERWPRKIFRLKSRDFYRLMADNQEPLDLCLTLQDERVFCTSILDLSASGFGCYIKGLTRIHAGQPITPVFVLPLEEPRIIKSEVFLASVQKGDDEGEIFRFRFYEEMKDEDRDLIHRYIVLKQFKTLEKMNQANSWQYDEDYPEASTGD